MSEVVHIQVGDGGNQVGSTYWNLLAEEHGLDKTGFALASATCKQLEKIRVCYNEERRGNFTPRAIIADADALSLYAYKDSHIFREFFKSENVICGWNSPGKNWAMGHFTEGQELLGPILDRVRREAEMAESVQGFQMVHSLGLGAGSGLATLLLSKLQEEYPGRIMWTYSTFPSPKVSETVVEPYNAILSVNELIQFSNETFCIDNDALSEIYQKTLCVSSPDFADLNELVSVMMSGVTTCQRFTCDPNTDMRKSSMNAVPYPKLHFVIPGYAPLSARNIQKFMNFSLSELVQQLFDPCSMMAMCDPTNGKYFAANAIFRGEVSAKNLEKQLMKIRNQNSKYFIEWVPNNLNVTLSDVPPRGLNMSVTFIGNTSCIREVFRRISGQCSAMLKKKAFLHWYTAEGLTVEEIEEATNNVNELALEYQQYQDMLSDYDDDQADDDFDKDADD